MNVVDLECPFTKRIPADPVIAPNGRTYERGELLERSDGNDGFIGRFVIDEKTLQPDAVRLQNIERFLETADVKVRQDWNKRRKTVLASKQRDAEELASLGQLDQAAEMGHLKSVLKQAQTFYEQKNFALALQRLSKVVPSTPQSSMLTGDVYNAMGRHGEAFEHYVKCMDSLRLDAHWKICQMYAEDGNLHQAIVWNARAFKKVGLCGKEKHVRRLAECYRDGVGVDVDLEKSIEFFKVLATNYGDVEAQFIVAKHQLGADSDVVGGIRRLISASNKGQDEALECVERLKAFLSELF
jgi:TPR repeat protein